MSEAGFIVDAGGTEPEPEPSVGGERRAAVDRARKAWIDQLIDRSRRNNLLYFRELKNAALDLSTAAPEILTSLLEEEAVPLSKLLPDGDNLRAPAILREIQRRARANLEEKGLQTLFLALGMATWPAGDGGRDPEAPVLLIPITVEWRGREGRAAALRRAGEAQVNLVLLHALETEHGCQVTPESLLANAASDGTEDGNEENGEELPRLDPAHVYRRLREAAGEVPSFAVQERAVLGNFSFQKMAMVKDLQELGEALAGHDVVAALAGDAAAGTAVRATRHPVNLRELDRISPDEEFLVLDADASQQAVIGAARGGQHLVIQGPPGTGKSQTIANMIATLTTEGRRVLFVAEKRAALEVVLGRLRDVGLDYLALDLHGADFSRRATMERLAQSLHRVREAAPVEAAATHQRFSDDRARLNEHVARIHGSRPPSEKSVYELETILLRLPAAARAATRWRGADLARLDPAAAGAVVHLLQEAAGFDRLFIGDDPSPWTGACLPDGAAVQQATDAVARIVTTHWPRLEAAMRQLAANTPLPPPESLQQFQAMVALVQEISLTLTRCSNELFRQDLDALEATLAPAGEGALARAWALVSNGGYRKACKTVRSLTNDPSVPPAVLLAAVTAAARQAEAWRKRCPSAPLPQAPVDVEPAQQILAAIQPDLALLAQALGRPSFESLPLQELHSLMERLQSDSVTPHRIPRLLQIERELAEHGASAIVQEIRDRKPDASHWPALFESAWHASSFDQARVEDPQIGGFNGRTHEEAVRSFRDLDRERLKLAAARARRAHAETVIRTMNEHPEQEALIKREIEKRSRHLPLRLLLAQAPEVLTALCPCWMASPLSVSQLLAGDRCYFDTVIFDEASQVLPHDAIPALLRATQAVVAGDEHQLSPTLFFADGGDDMGDDGAPTAGFESLLQLMRSVAGDPLPLQWHYRSRDESLITFSNHHIYRPNSQEMITFPGPRARGAITHVLVDQALGQDGEDESCSEEVRRVAALVLEHAEQRPGETLGVIAMGIRHAERIQAALDEALRSRPDLEEFFDESRPERFFVKNLERVQGDERDAILLSIGYGKDRSGRLPYRFGPLLQESGYRRLNVAVTRARRRMTLVSSFSHLDMDPGRSRARGVELLRLYLQFAASGGKLLGDTGGVEVPLNGFEADIFEALTRKGMLLLPQWGASRCRIDLVAQHPDRPGRFVLAIECDGASYHSTPTARDRDRLRQQHLEALGWWFHRIWSADWFVRREEEIERAWEAYQIAIAAADYEDAHLDAAPEAAAIEPEGIPGIPEHSLVTSRAHRPAIVRRDTITQYHHHELRALIQWIQSDGRLRTDDELIAELVRELGFQKRGSRIEAVCREALRLTKPSGPEDRAAGFVQPTA